MSAIGIYGAFRRLMLTGDAEPDDQILQIGCRVTDYANEAIRHGILTREEGIRIVERFDDSCAPDYIAGFCDYIEISVDAFWEQVHRSVNRDLFDVSNDGRITRKFEWGQAYIRNLAWGLLIMGAAMSPPPATLRKIGYPPPLRKGDSDAQSNHHSGVMPFRRPWISCGQADSTS